MDDPSGAVDVEPVTHGEVRVQARTPFLAAHSCEEQCHNEIEPNPEKRPLREFHTDRRVDHGFVNQWCPDCHEPTNYDVLHLDDGTPVSFNEAYRVCGQCHAPKLRDWEHGIHGTETGNWMTGAVRHSCPVCHDPHDPTRPKFESLPPPQGPREPWPRGHLSTAARPIPNDTAAEDEDGHP